MSKGSGDRGPLSWLKLLHLDVHSFLFTQKFLAVSELHGTEVEWIEIEEGKEEHESNTSHEPAFSLCGQKVL